MNHSQFSSNWAGNYRYHAARLHSPKTTGELQQLVRHSAQIKAIGTRHSFNAVADTDGEHVSLIHFDEITLDRNASSVTIGAGINYGRLAPYLYEQGYALHNLASLPHIGVVGACATATHGSGVKNESLASAVLSVEFVDGRGEYRKLSRGDADFNGAVVSLGALGIITSITLGVQPAFNMRQAVYEHLDFDQLQEHLEEIFASGYSVSLFTGWEGHRAAQVWVKRLDDGTAFAPEFYGAKLATVKLHPLPGHPVENCTEQLCAQGPWHERLPHFRMEFTPSSGAELQTEYFVPRDKGYAAIRAIEALRDRIKPHLYVTELRAIAADRLWMSPFYGRDSLGIHFTWKPDWPAVQGLLPVIEEPLASLGMRPHWAKLFSAQPGRSYEKLSDFQALVERYDPEGKFRNAFLEEKVFVS